MSEKIEKAIAANKECPHLDNHEIVLELVELNKKVTDLQNAISVLLSSEKPVVAPVESTDSTEKE